MKYWWVNHKQTVRQEVGDGYLWSPKREANGARSQFYENMRLASPGDFVLSFAGGRIGHAGIVSDYPLNAPKPDAFGTVGAYWSNDGWLLPVDWTPLPIAIQPKTLLTQLRPLLPPKYSPIHPMSGAGNQKAYLAEINEKMFGLIMAAASVSTNFLRSVTAVTSETVNQLEVACELKIEEDTSLSTTEKQQLIEARKGQGIFRRRVFEVEKYCRLTQLANQALLVASHIKPWRMCSTSGERLDGYNGLLLAPHVDRLFDRGLMSFTDSGDVLLSSKLDPSDIEKLGISSACARNCGSFSPNQIQYLRFHRETVLLP